MKVWAMAVSILLLSSVVYSAGIMNDITSWFRSLVERVLYVKEGHGPITIPAGDTGAHEIERYFPNETSDTSYPTPVVGSSVNAEATPSRNIAVRQTFSYDEFIIRKDIGVAGEKLYIKMTIEPMKKLALKDHLPDGFDVLGKEEVRDNYVILEFADKPEIVYILKGSGVYEITRPVIENE